MYFQNSGGRKEECQRKTYWSSLKYVKPMNGSWLPTKALGGGKVSPLLSSAMSSKLLVSMSPESSGTTGATAGGQRQRGSHGANGKKRRCKPRGVEREYDDVLHTF